ncbi:DUF58 domain-containing protein [Alteribacillus iranensis]|uniref:Uncharacterized conserved protein, DUF58 family, contains vWF domain n=1 Tax=Alteribacillus iranensis TaxID=930128 RepID=A0A1I2E8Z6_9BACI|nr:DUF58 domain-containing protein [Alteribacillus iranensis]SFE89163.1 Uncharacterized conserved protein, DUF58 family, contains vWF domain [Alteribacillus iranensis]
MNVKRQLLKTGKLLSILFMTGALYAYAMFQGGYVSWFLFYSVCGVLIVNFLLCIYPFRLFHLERTLDNNLIHLGETTEVTLTIRKKYPFPLLFISMYDSVPGGLNGQGTPPGTITFFPHTSPLHYTYHIEGGKRGDHVFSTIALGTGDLFGFYQREGERRISDTLTVLPKIRPLRDWRALQESNEVTGSVTAPFMNDALSIAGVRDYVAGDRLTSIDWKVTARAGKLVTKEFESQSSKGYVLIVENTGKLDENDFEIQIEFAASLVNHSLSSGRPVTFYDTAQTTKTLEMETQGAYHQHIFKELARLQKTEGESQLSHLLNDNHNVPSIVYITSRFTSRERQCLEPMLSPTRDIVVVYTPGHSATDIEREELNKYRQSGGSVLLLQLSGGKYTVDDKEGGALFA